MSRIGKLPIKIPENVNVTCNGSKINVKGQFGTLKSKIPKVLCLNNNNGILVVELKEDTRTNRALHGLYRSLINNMVIGVSQQFKQTLKLQGVGYRAILQGKEIILNLGFSHSVNILIPDEINVEVIQNTIINLTACNKESLGLFASKIRSWRIPEPYKGKGIIYEGEVIQRKSGITGLINGSQTKYKR